ncbi:hypothetical protein ACIHFC_03295 [Streptomyces sp. NPDC052013]|uniref:hypothetical protein n=1 Tax=Streptomyces sp. NPDC052013 TaxID=3365679 RepID=UPI0037D0C5F3
MAVPEPGSKKDDTRRVRLRKDAERAGVSDQDADAAADEELQEGEEAVRSLAQPQAAPRAGAWPRG